MRLWTTNGEDSSAGPLRVKRMEPQLEKNHVVPTAWQDEALARDGVSREVPCSALKGETVPEDPTWIPSVGRVDI